MKSKTADIPLSNKVLNRVKQAEEHFKELDKRKLRYDIREKALMMSLPLAIHKDVKEAVKKLKEYVAKTHSRRDSLNKINAIFGRRLTE